MLNAISNYVCYCDFFSFEMAFAIDGKSSHTYYTRGAKMNVNGSVLLFQFVIIPQNRGRQYKTWVKIYLCCSFKKFLNVYLNRNANSERNYCEIPEVSTGIVNDQDFVRIQGDWEKLNHVSRDGPDGSWCACTTYN